MKLTLVLAVAVAALGGALLATVLRDGGDTDVVQQRPADQIQQSPAGQSAQPAQETPPANRGSDRAARRDRPSPQRSDSRFLDPDDRPIGRRELGRVRDAAVRAAGGGTVTDIDRSDDLGVAYEVELIQNRQEVDVRLDRNLALVATDYGD